MKIGGLYLETQRPRAINRVPYVLFGLVVAVILYAGLNPDGKPFRNGATWSTDGPGLEFDGAGLAYTFPFVDEVTAERFRESGFTLEMVLEVPDAVGSKFMFLADFHDGSDANQLLLGQWRRWLILMNGDDYDHSRRLPRISVDLSSDLGRPLLVTCTSGVEGSRVYIDGVLRFEKRDVRLTIPGGLPSGRLVLGNSVYGDNPWTGRLGGISLYSRVQSPEEVRDNHTHRHGILALSPIRPEGCELWVPMVEGRGEIAWDRSGQGRDVAVRSDVTYLSRRVFDPLSSYGRFDASFWSDFRVNLFGFVPFGFLLMSLIAGSRKRGMIANIVSVTIAGFLLSVGIEFVQSWFPARNSSLLDLLLNTLGAELGAWLWVAFSKFLGRF
ncbi:MAG: hypothetical protein DRP71_15530 [Verrucomicrobia bacterium]|nr:MAG: hypothetical protein DRP71_15530 [Verrucomicrobiota bacterium]